MCLTLHGEQCLSGTYMVTCFAKGTERANVYKSKIAVFFMCKHQSAEASVARFCPPPIHRASVRVVRRPRVGRPPRHCARLSAAPSAARPGTAVWHQVSQPEGQFKLPSRLGTALQASQGSFSARLTRTRVTAGPGGAISSATSLRGG